MAAPPGLAGRCTGYLGVRRARELADAANPNPATSVVDASHQCWDVPNLYLCDGSSFVAGGAVNPTSTIGALALRCADGILAREDARGQDGQPRQGMGVHIPDASLTDLRGRWRGAA